MSDIGGMISSFFNGMSFISYQGVSHNLESLRRIDGHFVGC